VVEIQLAGRLVIEELARIILFVSREVWCRADGIGERN